MHKQENKSESSRRMEPGVFGAARMRESRACVRIAGRCVQVRLGAASRPRAGSMFFRVTHFDAATTQVRFRAMAVASSRRNLTQQRRSVAKDRERAGQDSHRNARHPQKRRMARKHGFEQGKHEAILRKMRKKTDSSGRLVVLEPAGSVRVMEKAKLPILERRGVPN